MIQAKRLQHLHKHDHKHDPSSHSQLFEWKGKKFSFQTISLSNSREIWIKKTKKYWDFSSGYTHKIRYFLYILAKWKWTLPSICSLAFLCSKSSWQTAHLLVWVFHYFGYLNLGALVAVFPVCFTVFHPLTHICLQGSSASPLIIFHLVFRIVVEMNSWFTASLCFKSALYSRETLKRYPRCRYSLWLLGIFCMKVHLSIPLIIAHKRSIIWE